MVLAHRQQQQLMRPAIQMASTRTPATAAMIMINVESRTEGGGVVGVGVVCTGGAPAVGQHQEYTV